MKLLNPITCPVHTSSLRSPRAVAISDSINSLTFEEFDYRIESIRTKLTQLNISAGDIVAIIAENSIDYTALVFATARIGALFAAINIRTRDKDINDLLAEVSPKLLLLSKEQAHPRYDFALPYSVLEDLFANLPRAVVADPKIDLAAESTILFTSGSTGKSKGVVLTNGNHYYNALGSNENIPLHKGDCWLLSLPLYHAGGLSILYRCAIAGATVRLEDFDATSVSGLIDSGKISHVSLVPTMLKKLLDHRVPTPFPKLLKAILLGGASLPKALRTQIKQLALPVLTTYGLTETASQLCTLSLSDFPDHLSTSGKPLKYRHAQILNDHNNPLPPGEVGEIVASGEVLFKRYLNSDSGARTPTGQFRTGDLGFLDEDGYLTVVERKDDMFISGGENIYPIEIESVAESYQGVTAAKVIAIDDETWGKRPLLFVEVPDPDLVDILKLAEYVSSQLASYKTPELFVSLKRFPRTPLDKIDKQRLLEIYSSR